MVNIWKTARQSAGKCMLMTAVRRIIGWKGNKKITSGFNNFADIFLSFAIVLFGIDLFFLEPKRAKKEKLNAENNN